MSPLRASVAPLLALLVAAPVAGAGEPENRSATVTGLTSLPPERVLFIGNSHTERYGGMDWLVGNLVAAEDPPHAFEGDTETASGVTLEYHYKNGAPERIRRGDYDVVVLQGYLPGSPTRTAGPFLHYAKLLDEVARQSGARTVFYMTWPQARYPWADLDDFIAAHRQISAELGAPVAPVGVAMERARAERPDLVLMDPDEIHASWAGAYLAAATIYAAIYQRSPEGLPFAFGVNEEDATFLQHIAWETVTEWQEVVAPAPSFSDEPVALAEGGAFAEHLGATEDREATES